MIYEGRYFHSHEIQHNLEKFKDLLDHIILITNSHILNPEIHQIQFEFGFLIPFLMLEDVIFFF